MLNQPHSLEPPCCSCTRCGLPHGCDNLPHRCGLPHGCDNLPHGSQKTCHGTSFGMLNFHHLTSSYISDQQCVRLFLNNVPQLTYVSAPQLTCLDSSQVFNTRSYPSPHNDLTEGFFRIGGVDLRYMVHGHGPHVLFFTYGVLGEIQNSFKKQIQAFDPAEFTSIFWDPPGYGKSFPRDRHFVPYQYVEDDVSIAYDLLKFLNVSKVSLFGWCDGGHLSILFAVKFPQMVLKLIIWGTKASITRDNVRVFERMRLLSNWSTVARSEVLKAYDHDSAYITTIFNRYVDTVNVYFKSFGGNVCRELLAYVAAPVLVFHSANDVMVSTQQVRDLASELHVSELQTFGTGGHSCHIKHWQKFNEISQEFILG